MNIDKSSDKQKLVLLGASGSIGKQSIDIIRKENQRFDLAAFAVHSSLGYAYDLACEFKPSCVVIGDKSLKQQKPAILAELEEFLSSYGARLLFGTESLAYLASEEFIEEQGIDIIINALVGAIGSRASYNALASKKVRLALANKESLVVAGELLMPLSSPERLLPVDSEHSAIYQCFLGEDPAELKQILLTASGGPFFGKTKEELLRVSPDQALAHPNWSMGRKISIDSASLMNKGLEAIEAMHLFDVDIDKIKILIQRESIIHSMVEFIDGSIKAHLGPSDMRIPIQFALSYPKRWDSPCESLDFAQLAQLNFAEPDLESFSCLSLALEAAKQKGVLPCIMNAANEVAVSAFLEKKIGFTQIPELIESCMQSFTPERVQSLEQLETYDLEARARSRELLASLSN